MTADALELEDSLRRLGSAERAAGSKAYLKSDLEFAGVAVPVMRTAIADWTRERSGLAHGGLAHGGLDHGGLDHGGLDHGGLDHDRLVAVVRALWTRPLYECRQSAVILLERNVRLLTPSDIDLLEHLLRHSGTWALVDGLATNVAGVLAERYDVTGTLDRWAADPDFWIRRSAMLALLRPLRRGEGDFDRFAGYADAMLEEKEFFIRKAIGWVLREVAKKRPELVAAWLGPRVHRASGVTVREAIKYLPDDSRDLLLAGYKTRQPVVFQ
jgi:3-methyladenine DNA glycosylase AlkD